MNDKAINHGFTAEESAWLMAQFSPAQSSTGFDQDTIKRLSDTRTAAPRTESSAWWAHPAVVYTSE